MHKNANMQYSHTEIRGIQSEKILVEQVRSADQAGGVIKSSAESHLYIHHSEFGGAGDHTHSLFLQQTLTVSPYTRVHAGGLL